jgi:hypothetical protein
VVEAKTTGNEHQSKQTRVEEVEDEEGHPR